MFLHVNSNLRLNLLHFKRLQLATRLAGHHDCDACNLQDGLFAGLYLNEEGSSAKTFLEGVAQGHNPCTVPSCTATRYSAFGQKPVTRPPWGLERAGGTAGYCDAFFTVSTAICLFSSYKILSLRTISPDRPQTGDLDEHPCSGFRGARAMRLRGLLSGVTTYTANQCAAGAWKSIGFGGYGQLSEVLSEAKGQLSHVT